jgi:hypothetical protein
MACLPLPVPMERDHIRDQDVDVRVILNKPDGRVWTGFMWLRVGSGSGLL